MNVLKKIIFPAVLLLAVAMYYFLFDKPREERKKLEEEESKQIFAFKPEDVATVKIERQGEVFMAQREGEDRWKIVEPYEAAGDKAKYRSLLSGVAGGRIQRNIEDPGELGNYGLDDPRIKVTLTVKDATEEHTLLFGDKIPSGPDYFAKREGDPAVFTVYSNVFENANKDLFEFLDKSLLDFEVNDVKSYEVLAGDTALAIDFSNDKNVKMLHPYQLRAKDTDAKGLLWKVKQGKIARFGPRGVQKFDLGTYGLVNPATKVVLGFGAEGTDRTYKSILIGDATREMGKTQYWAVREHGSDVFVIEESTANDFYKNPDELIYNKIGKVKGWEAKYFELQRRGETITLTKEGDDWNMTSPQELPGKSDGINDFLNKFAGYSGFTVSEHIRGATDLARYHLADPPYRVTVKSDNLEETYTVSDLILEKDEQGNDIRRVYAQWGEYPDVVLVMEETRPIIDMLESPLSDFGEFPTPTPAPTSTPAPTLPPAPPEPEPEQRSESGAETGRAERMEAGSAAKAPATGEAGSESKSE